MRRPEDPVGEAVTELGSEDAGLIDAFADHLALERRLSPHTVRAYRVDVT